MLVFGFLSAAGSTSRLPYHRVLRVFIFCSLGKSTSFFEVLLSLTFTFFVSSVLGQLLFQLHRSFLLLFHHHEGSCCVHAGTFSWGYRWDVWGMGLLLRGFLRGFFRDSSSGRSRHARKSGNRRAIDGVFLRPGRQKIDGSRGKWRGSSPSASASASRMCDHTTTTTSQRLTIQHPSPSKINTGDARRKRFPRRRGGEEGAVRRWSGG